MATFALTNSVENHKNNQSENHQAVNEKRTKTLLNLVVTVC